MYSPSSFPNTYLPGTCSDPHGPPHTATLLCPASGAHQHAIAPVTHTSLYRAGLSPLHPDSCPSWRLSAFAQTALPVRFLPRRGPVVLRASSSNSTCRQPFGLGWLKHQSLSKHVHLLEFRTLSCLAVISPTVPVTITDKQQVIDGL